MTSAKPYRQSVVGVFANKHGKVLVGERSDNPGSWQFPQGGIEPGEDPRDAILREMSEEIGTRAIRICKIAHETCRYEFPPDLSAAIAGKYAGQEQTWFLLAFVEEFEPDPQMGDGEFSRFQWVDVNDALAGIIHWKKPCYRRGLELLDLLI